VLTSKKCQKTWIFWAST